MARTTKPLTDTEVKQAKSSDKEFNLADGGGLYLRIKPNGAKLWLFNYTKPFSDRKRANLSLGQYPAVTLAMARQQRQDLRSLLAQGTDPKTHRTEYKRQQGEAHGNTLAFVFGKWIKIKKTSVTPAYAEDIERSLKLHVLPKLGNWPIHKIKAPDVIEILDPISARGALETVRRLCQRLNEVMVYAANAGITDNNPLAGISKAFESPEKTHFPTLQPAQLGDLMRAIASASIKLTTRSLIEWQLHTMVRPSEAAGAKWSEIDTVRSLWVIPASRMKKKRTHTVPLTEQTLLLLDVMRPISAHREHIFPAERNPRTHINEQTANMALKRMGYSGPLTQPALSADSSKGPDIPKPRLVAHGMRALASTTLNEQGFDPDVIESALSHTDKNEVRAAYNRAEYLERRRVMMAWWSTHIEQAANGNLGLSGAKRLRAVV